MYKAQSSPKTTQDTSKKDRKEGLSLLDAKMCFKVLVTEACLGAD